ncbi:probable protein phosphatase 2C 28 [Morus notabilis]|nr:probable protein phosphatase 2C 28 [Morus notabilis]
MKADRWLQNKLPLVINSQAVHGAEQSTTRHSSEEISKELKMNKLSKQRSGYDVHSDEIKGKMGHGMEDYIAAENRKIDGYELGLYAIFDGHSGRDVAEYLQGRLFDNILSEPDFWTSPKKAVRKAYEATDDEILKKVVGSRGGSTAVTAILIDQRELIVANAGDSRAVLCRNGKAKQISVDHEPTKEKELVESKGGFVTEMPGSVPRVDGQLAMTRAFGDAKLKEHITSEPDIKVENIDDDTEFIILASDGFWKVMSNQEAYNSIEDMEDAQEAAETLIREALSRKSYGDISCIVVMFH